MSAASTWVWGNPALGFVLREPASSGFIQPLPAERTKLPRCPLEEEASWRIAGQRLLKAVSRDALRHL